MIDSWNKYVAIATVYGNHVYNWLQKHVPVYWGHVDRTIGPYVRIARQKAGIAFAFIWDSLVPVRDWANKSVVPVLVRIQKELIPVGIRFLQDFWLAVRAVMIEFGIWIQENVLTGSLAPEQLSKFASDSVGRLHSSSQHVMSWVSKQVAALTN